MRRFEVTRSTVRRAIEELESRYLVRRVQGSGTYVNSRVDYVISPRIAPSLHETVAKAGVSARTFLVNSGPVLPPAEVAEALEIDATQECMRLNRIGYIDDHPATTASEWIAPGIFENIDVSVRAFESLSEVFRGSRTNPTRAWSRVSTEFPAAPILTDLGLDRPSSVWLLETLTRDGRHGTPLSFSRSRLRQDRVRVVVEFEPPQ